MCEGEREKDKSEGIERDFVKLIIRIEASSQCKVTLNFFKTAKIPYHTKSSSEISERSSCIMSWENTPKIITLWEMSRIMPSTFHKVGRDLTLLFNQLCQQFEKSSTPPNNQQQCWPTFCIPEVANNIPTFHTLHFTTTKGPVLGRFFHSFSCFSKVCP